MTYEAEINGAYEDILEAGELGTILRATTTTPDPSKPWNDDITDKKHTCATLWLSAGKGGAKRSGTSTLKSVRKVLIAAKGLSITPVANDYIVRANGDRWALDIVDPLDFNGEPILYKVRVSKVLIHHLGQ